MNLALPIVLLFASATALHAADVASLQPAKHVGPPLKEQAVDNRAFQGIPSMAVAPKGRLWSTWYAGVTPGEDQNNYVVLSTSGDGGKTWKEVLVIDPDGSGPVRAFDPELWVAPDGRLFSFWAQMDKSRGDTQLGVWCMETTEPEAEQPKWSAPRRVGDGVMMCKPFTLSTGEWVLPISKWRTHDKSAQMVVSTDQGKTWAVRGGCNVPVDVRNYDEHMFIERKDGTIWLLVRTKYGIGESISTDGGKTWPELKPSQIPHTASRFFIQRLASGHLLLIKHGPFDKKTGRSDLMAFISKDDGKTWGGGLMLDERNGVSYPDGQQASDGLIHIIYDFNRTRDRNILVATFREEDAVAAKEVSKDVRLRQVISKATGGKEKTAPPADPPKTKVDGEALRKKTLGILSGPNVQPVELKKGSKLFADRAYTAGELPEAFKAAHFLPVAMEGAKTITCKQAGTVWFLTPTAERNRDSQTRSLQDQGFKPVDLPEINLFGPAPTANRCTVYQKDCAAGDKISVGKWAVPVFFP